MFNWLSLGKKTSKLGKWMADNGVTQAELVRESGVHRNTIAKLCSGDYDETKPPRKEVTTKILKALRQLVEGAEVSKKDFWA